MADTPAVTTAVKPGIKTTEFALTIFVNLVTIGMAFTGNLPPATATIILAAVNAVYGVMRAIIKANDPGYVVPVLPAGVGQ